MRERRDAKKKQEQEAVENKLRRIQLRESFNSLKSKLSEVYLLCIRSCLCIASLKTRLI
jgi:hypothetical protein